ncbi:hypothetical protein N136_02244 [Leifsonia aquatica ATCC 14665]|uniref:DUF1016 domain-containing protein n=2 Tax=Leifsonia aquatica TaxID=144185 RepID=U2R839_LEIAQ|nr:PDDEXK nuclease domain-containing protein [Leifsonia aquatica]ERK71405.1 hypothetical protein N136_02244 [Leifsonia aquatica ATCC 14665]
MVGGRDYARRMKDIAIPPGYGMVLADLRQRVRAARARAQRAANSELIGLYWSIGRTILEQQQIAGWGAGVVDQLARDLADSFPEMRGLSRRNLLYMRAFSEAWPDKSIEAFVQQPVAQLPWGHVTTLLDKLDSREARDWYAAESVRLGWSRALLVDRISADTRNRVGAAPSNFEVHLDGIDSARAQQLTRDPYVFDFLAVGDQARERDVEAALTERIEHTLLELGDGFAFVGRQKHFDVDGDDFYIDLLFFHTVQLRYIVVELKIGRFEPSRAGQLGFYVALVDDRLRLPMHAPTVGILLCTDRNEAVVRYSLGGTAQPVAVSTYTYDALPLAEKHALPSADDLTKALAEASGT